MAIKLTPEQSVKQKESMQAVIKLLDITPPQLAAALNVSFGLVYRWLRGEDPVSARSAYRISMLIPEVRPEQLCFTLNTNIHK